MDYLAVHVGDLLTHLSDLLLARTNVSLQFFDLIVQNEFEFLELLGLFLQLIDSGHFVSYSFISLLYFFGLGLLSLQIFLVFLFDLFDIL